MSIESIRLRLLPVTAEYPISRITLFGSRAEGTNREDSDVDLIVEFSCAVSLLTLSALRCKLVELLGVEVDVIHGPMQSGDMIEIGKVVELYAA